MREEFEKLPEVAEVIENEGAIFIGDGYRIRNNELTEAFLDGAWYAYQEQQKIIDELKARVRILDTLEAMVNFGGGK